LGTARLRRASVPNHSPTIATKEIPVKAIWNGEVLAESDATIVVEGNHYFPPGSVKRERFSASETRTHCGWKGEAHYYDVVVGGETNADAAWFYPTPLDAAKQITDHVAFWRGVDVTD
jgi:uncharacterized protein (DUF427 family)